jgi:hypothetical protein
MKKENIFFITIILLLVLITGCTSLMEKTGQFLDGSLLEAKKINEYRVTKNGGSVVNTMQNKKDGNEYLLITTDAMPNITFKASMPDASGRFYVTSYTFLSSSVFGWNEFTMDVSASGTFAVSGNTASLQINNPIEVINISSGKIRYNDERLVDDAALRSLNNRYERILALVEWMKAQPNVPVFTSEKHFSSYWQPIILPESLSAKKRPSSWSKEDTEWNYADDINWNVTYTKKIFPEDLHIYRNSGALLRDFEEAISWIYLEYDWNDLCNQLNATIQLTKKQ